MTELRVEIVDGSQLLIEINPGLWRDCGWIETDQSGVVEFFFGNLGERAAELLSFLAQQPYVLRVELNSNYLDLEDTIIGVRMRREQDVQYQSMLTITPTADTGWERLLRKIKQAIGEIYEERLIKGFEDLYTASYLEAVRCQATIDLSTGMVVHSEGGFNREQDSSLWQPSGT